MIVDRHPPVKYRSACECITCMRSRSRHRKYCSDHWLCKTKYIGYGLGTVKIISITNEDLLLECRTGVITALKNYYNKVVDN